MYILSQISQAPPPISHSDHCHLSFNSNHLHLINTQLSEHYLSTHLTSVSCPISLTQSGLTPTLHSYLPQDRLYLPLLPVTHLVPLTGHFILKLSWNMQFVTYGATISQNSHVCVIVEHPMTKNCHWGCENVLKNTLYQINLQKHEARGNLQVTSWQNLALHILLIPPSLLSCVL